MSAYPGVNATLTAVTTPAGPDAYGDPTGAATVVWSGRADGYLKRARGTRLQAGQRVDDVIDVFFLLDTDGGPVATLTGVTEGQRVTIEDRRTSTPVTTSFRIAKTEHRHGGGTIADSQRWELEPDV